MTRAVLPESCMFRWAATGRAGTMRQPSRVASGDTHSNWVKLGPFFTLTRKFSGSAAAPGTEVTHGPWSDTKVWSVEDHTPADWLPADEGFLDMPKPTKAPAKPAVKPLVKPSAKPPAKPADQGRVGSQQKVSRARAATEGTHFSTTPLPASARPPSPSSSSTPLSRKARSPEVSSGWLGRY